MSGGRDFHAVRLERLVILREIGTWNERKEKVGCFISNTNAFYRKQRGFSPLERGRRILVFTALRQGSAGRSWGMVSKGDPEGLLVQTSYVRDKVRKTQRS